MTRRTALALVAPALLLGVAQARAAEPLDLWPLVVRDARPVAGRATTRIGGPFFESWQEPGGERGWTLRPWLARRHGEQQSQLEFLYPLGALHQSEQRTRLRLVPLLDRSWTATADDGAEDAGSSWTFLLAFGGRTAAGERYGGLFPLAGVARNRFGVEHLQFWLFPLFGRSRDASGYTKTHLLWPFVSWGSGGGRRTLRIWPFYGHDVREGEFERRFALWPFLHWRTERPGDALEQRVRLWLPFYGETRRRHARSRFVLGPLYMHAENDLTGERTTDLLWPFVRIAERPASETFEGSSELRVEPFFRRRRGPGWERRGVLLGAFERSAGERDGLAFESQRLLYVSRFERLHDLESGDLRVRRQLWPLFRYAARSSGEAAPTGRLQVPWLLPLAGDGWLRHGLGLLTFYERSWHDGEERSDWLFGLARSRRAPDYRLDAFSWLFRSEQQGASRRLRVLGIPFERGAGSVGQQPAPSLAKPLASD